MLHYGGLLRCLLLRHPLGSLLLPGQLGVSAHRFQTGRDRRCRRPIEIDVEAESFVCGALQPRATSRVPEVYFVLPVNKALQDQGLVESFADDAVVRFEVHDVHDNPGGGREE
eukprot:6035832-Pyramimonas_sp.AAC.1